MTDKQRLDQLKAEQRTKVGEVCDFCGRPPGRWVYIAHRATCRWEGDPLPMVMDPEWTACDTCHPLIQKNDRAALAHHAATGVPESILMKDLSQEQLHRLEEHEQFARRIHEVFFQNWQRDIPPRHNTPENLRPN